MANEPPAAFNFDFDFGFLRSIFSTQITRNLFEARDENRRLQNFNAERLSQIKQVCVVRHNYLRAARQCAREKNVVVHIAAALFAQRHRLGINCFSANPIKQRMPIHAVKCSRRARKSFRSIFVFLKDFFGDRQLEAPLRQQDEAPPRNVGARAGGRDENVCVNDHSHFRRRFSARTVRMTS